MEKVLRRTIIAGLFAFPFICLIVADQLFFPYITGKNFAFRIIVELITALWLSLALVSPAYRPKRSWILGAFSLFVLIIAIADAQGVNPFKSFWSNYERMDGWVTLIHLLLLLVVASSVMRAEQLWRRFWLVTLVVSAFVSLYGFLQIAGDLSLGQGGSAGLMARIDATFGNSIYLAIYMLFNIFIAAWLWVVEGRDGWDTTERWLAPIAIVASLIVVALSLAPATVFGALLFSLVLVAGVWALMLAERKYFFALVIAFDTIALFFTGTRGTMLGLIGGALLALIIYSFTPSASKRMRRWSVGSIVAVLVLGGGLWFARDTSFVHSVGFLDRLASISTTDTTIASRFTNMSIAWRGVQERPILGWGQENYAIVFDKYYDPRMYADEPWFDRVHDIVFDWWIAGGTLGLLSYLAIFAAALLALWRKASGFTDAEKSVLTGLLAGYFAHNLTVFDNITSYILFAFVLAYIVYRATAATEARPLCERRFLPSSALPLTAVVGVVLFAGAAWYVNGNALLANLTLISALSSQGNPSQNLALFERSIAYRTFGMQEAREQLSQMASQIASVSGVDASTKQQFFQTAVSEMQRQETMSPLDARFPLFLGIVQDAYGDYADGLASLQKAHELSPDKQSILFQIGITQQALGNSALALASFKQAYELAPAYIDARLMYAAQAIAMGNDALADQLLAPVIPTGQAADARIAAAYASRGEYGKIATIWKAHVQADPTDIQGYFTLAAAYVGAKDPTDAIAALQAVEAVSPSVKTQADSLIQQIQNGTAKVQ